MEKWPSGHEHQGNFLLRLSELGNAPPHIPAQAEDGDGAGGKVWGLERGHFPT